MNIKKPSPRTPADLVHPKGELIAWNGDKRKAPNPSRWNGAPDMEESGFVSRGLVTTVEGVNKPSNVRPLTSPSAIQPHPSGVMAYSPWSNPKQDKPPDPTINKRKKS
jgi:hypothetical protein